MTTPRGRYQPADPAAMPRDGVHAPVRRVVAERRGVRQHIGLVVVGAMAMAVVAAGIGLGGRGDEPPPSGSLAAVAPSSSAKRSASPSPTPTPRRTEAPDRPCLRHDSATAPEIRLWSTAGDQASKLGAPPPSDDGASPVPVVEWPSIGEVDPLVLARRADLGILAESRRCIQVATADFAPADGAWDVAQPVGRGTFERDELTNRITIGELPPGTWMVRVIVTFAMTPGWQGPATTSQRFFGVISDPTAPEPTPLVTPAAPCTPPRGVVPDLRLQVGDGTPVTGFDLRDAIGDPQNPGPFDLRDVPVVVEGDFREPLLLSAVGVCMTSWNIEWLDLQGLGVMSNYVQENPYDDPRVVSQSGIQLDQTTIGEALVRATIGFGPGAEALVAWRINIDPPIVSDLVVRGPDGTEVTAVRGCGISWNSGEVGAWEPCVATRVPDGTPLLRVPAGIPIDAFLAVEGRDSWNASCGIRLGPTNDFGLPNGWCDLGGGDANNPMRFLPWEGRFVVQIYVSIHLEDDSWVSAPYFVEIETTG